MEGLYYFIGCPMTAVCRRKYLLGYRPNSLLVLSYTCREKLLCVALKVLVMRL